MITPEVKKKTFKAANVYFSKNYEITTIGKFVFKMLFCSVMDNYIFFFQEKIMTDHKLLWGEYSVNSAQKNLKFKLGL